MQDNIKNKVIAILFGLIIYGFFFLNLVAPDKKSSVSERRKLEQFPKVSLKAIVSGDFFKKFDSYSMDQFYQREKFRKLKIKTDMVVLGNYNNMQIDNNYIYAKSEEDAVNYIYSLCYDVFRTRLERIMNMFDDLPKFTLRVRKMKTRWGVCNKSSMTVTLNTELITKDVNLIDYVIVHELCHFKHMDHSPKFWNEVAKYYPYYKQARKELNNK